MKLSRYQHLYRNISLERQGGILEMRLHSNGQALKWGIDPGSIHEQLSEAFYRIGRDPENNVLILCGSGETYCTERDVDEYRDISSSEALYRLMREGRDLLINLIEIESPIISVVHGPATIHPELPAMADIVLASPAACFQDSHVPVGIVPGDGAQIFWSAVLGPTRASYFFHAEEVLSCEEAHALGVVHEIHPVEKLMPRARELAMRLAQMSIYTLRGTRMAVNQSLKARLTNELAMGFCAETLAQLAAEGGHPLVIDVERERLRDELPSGAIKQEVGK